MTTFERISQLMENKNINSDRFGMAAISYICKAFGDNIRSKEYWPWSDRVNIPWEESKGTKNDLNTAINLIRLAIQRETEIENDKANRIEITNKGKSIKDLKRRLEKVQITNTASSKLSSRINKTTEIVNQNISEITE